MFGTNPKTSFWSLECNCGADFKITGKTILDTPEDIHCPNCQMPYSADALKKVVNDLISFLESIDQATYQRYTGKSGKPGFKKIIPPGFNDMPQLPELDLG